MIGKNINVYSHDCDLKEGSAKKQEGQGSDISFDYGCFDEKAQQRIEDVAAEQEEYLRGDLGGQLRLVFFKLAISSDKKMYACTGFPVWAFAILLASFEQEWAKAELDEMQRRCKCAEERIGRRGPRPKAEIVADKMNNIPLVHKDPARGSALGNRCDLEPAHILLLTLMWIYHSTNQNLLGILFGIDQSSVSRHLKVGRRVTGEPPLSSI